MSKQFKRSTRSMSKIVRNISPAQVTSSILSQTLFTSAEPRQTLTRIVGNVGVIHETQGVIDWAIVLARDGTLAIGDLTDVTIVDREAENILAHGAVPVTNNDLSDGHSLIPVDVKGQRKLRKTDVVTLISQSDAVNVGKIVLSLTIFLKEA